jgi:hypothetical protein
MWGVWWGRACLGHKAVFSCYFAQNTPSKQTFKKLCSAGLSCLHFSKHTNQTNKDKVKIDKKGKYVRGVYQYTWVEGELYKKWVVSG